MHDSKRKPKDRSRGNYPSENSIASKKPDQRQHRLSVILRHPKALTPLILLMGFLGAALRYVLEIAFPSGNGFPFATLIVNIFGCFVLEVINQYVGRRLHLPPPLVKSLGVGLIGAFTTISAFSTECLSFLQSGSFLLAGAYITATIFSTFIAAVLGRLFSQYLALRRVRHMKMKRPSSLEKEGQK